MSTFVEICKAAAMGALTIIATGVSLNTVSVMLDGNKMFVTGKSKEGVAIWSSSAHFADLGISARLDLIKRGIYSGNVTIVAE